MKNGKPNPSVKRRGWIEIQEAFFMALRSIWANRARSFLTLLGLMLGITAIVSIISVTQGVTNRLSDIDSPLKPECVTLTLTDAASAKKVSLSDLQQLQSDHDRILSEVVPYMRKTASVKYQTTTAEVTLVGTSELYPEIAEAKLQEGRLLQQSDIEKRQRVVVLGDSAAKALFGESDPLGQDLRLGSEVFSVVGVLKPTARTEAEAQLGLDQIVLLPYSAGRVQFSSSQITQYAIKAKSVRKLAQAEETVETFLAGRQVTAQAYQIKSEASQPESAGGSTMLVYLLVLGLAGISTLVGGIEIMNMMLLSVSERSREIGIRKALGASRFDIMMQFLIEGMVLSGCGGVIGAVAGSILSGILGSVMRIYALPNPLVLLAVIVFSILIGGFFSWEAASRAAKRSPAEALRKG